MLCRQIRSVLPKGRFNNRPMRMKSLMVQKISPLAALLVLTAQGATIIDEDFDASTSAPSGWVFSGATFVTDDPAYSRSGDNSVWINNLSSPSATVTIDLTGATTATFSFWWTTDIHGSAFGRTPFIQYTSNGTTFQQIGTFTVPSTTTSIPAHTQFSVTITDATYSFTSNSAFRILGDSSGGGTQAPVIVDDVLLTSDIPEPTAALLVCMAAFLCRRRRR